jgi:broad specificity polyphosphatase/5'/3'-nucleotidase SurE
MKRQDKKWAKTTTIDGPVAVPVLFEKAIEVIGVSGVATGVALACAAISSGGVGGVREASAVESPSS